MLRFVRDVQIQYHPTEPLYPAQTGAQTGGARLPAQMLVNVDGEAMHPLKPVTYPASIIREWLHDRNEGAETPLCKAVV